MLIINFSLMPTEEAKGEPHIKHCPPRTPVH